MQCRYISSMVLADAVAVGATEARLEGVARDRVYTAGELGELADGLRRLLAAVEAGSMTGDSGVVARLEGAVAALEALATGNATDSGHEAPSAKA